MTIYGYARVSTDDQNCDVQIAELKASGCNVVKMEKRSGTSMQGRDVLHTLLEFMAAGDELRVVRIDRLARSVADLQTIVHTLKRNGVKLVATQQPIDTSTAAGKCFLDMLGVFAEFETNLRSERQRDGIEAAKAKGVYKGRQAVISPAKVAELKAQGLGATEIAAKLGIARDSVYRLMKKAELVSA